MRTVYLMLDSERTVLSYADYQGTGFLPFELPSGLLPKNLLSGWMKVDDDGKLYEDKLLRSKFESNKHFYEGEFDGKINFVEEMFANEMMSNANLLASNKMLLEQLSNESIINASLEKRVQALEEKLKGGVTNE